MPDAYYQLKFSHYQPPKEYENIIKNKIPTYPTSLLDLYYFAHLLFDLYYHPIEKDDLLSYDYLSTYIQNPTELEWMDVYSIVGQLIASSVLFPMLVNRIVSWRVRFSLCLLPG